VSGGFEFGVDVALALEPDEPFAADAGLEDFDLKAWCDLDAGALVKVAARPDQGGPQGPVSVLRTQEEDFHLAVVADFGAEEAGSKHLRVVQDKAISSLEIGRQVAEEPVFKCAGIAADDEHAGAGPVGQGLLSNQLIGQMIIKVGQYHNDQSEIG